MTFTTFIFLIIINVRFIVIIISSMGSLLLNLSIFKQFANTSRYDKVVSSCKGSSSHIPFSHPRSPCKKLPSRSLGNLAYHLNFLKKRTNICLTVSYPILSTMQMGVSYSFDSEACRLKTHMTIRL